jgi:alkanesulfonate monooxygenase SsuD/methylene tetrahydromethanopterin reductase-like flavin-dependent oxidoreductase (luciferase family)
VAGCTCARRHRGARLDELLDHLGVLWSGRDETPRGRFWATPAAYVETPSPRVPLWASAFSAAALRRVGRRCDGWLPSAWIRDPAVATARTVAERLAGMRPVIDAAATEAGRDPADVGTVLRVNVAPGVGRDELAEAVALLVEQTGFRRVFLDPVYRDDDLDAWLASFVHLRDALS